MLGRRSWNITVECRQVFCVLHDGSVACVSRHPCVVASDTRRSTWNHSEPQHRGRQLQHQGSVSAPVETPCTIPHIFSCCGTFPKCLIPMSQTLLGRTFHRGCSYIADSILGTGLVAGRKESKEGRQTIFSTPLNPFGDNPDEEEISNDLSVPRKVDYRSK